MVDFKRLTKDVKPVAAPDEPTPNAEQQAVIDAVDKGRNILLTGPAGVGKSFVVERMKKKFRGRIAITSTTGVAALLVGGNTIHSWAGIGLGEGSAKDIGGKIADARSYPYERIVNAEILVIDEVSMLSAQLFTKLDHVFRIVRRSSEPFGGIQVILVGDYMQLPPVEKPKFQPQPFDDVEQQAEMFVEEEVGRYAFDSPSWQNAQIDVHELKTIVRQKEKEFSEVLNKVRLGIVDDQVKQLLLSRTGLTPPTEPVRPIQLYSTNAAVDRINHIELLKVKGDEKVYVADYTGMPWAIDNLKKNCMATEKITVRIGAQVMLLRNIDLSLGLVNGSMGVVKDIDEQGPMVEFADGLRYRCTRCTWEIKDGARVLASVTQIPLRLAYAITQHKSQGSSMDLVEMDLSSCFENGQAYVALSRCRTIAGMYIKKLDFSKIHACPRAKKFYGHE